jgi:hypothetical protein
MAHNNPSGTVVAADHNALLANLTLLHMLEIGAGPSLDYLALAKGSITIAGLDSSAGGSWGAGVAAGGHGRVAFNIGGLSGHGPRRGGLAIGVDAHPMFLSTGTALSLTAGLRAEWYSRRSELVRAIAAAKAESYRSDGKMRVARFFLKA